MASYYRATRSLRKGGLHKALDFADDTDLSKEHLKKASDSKNSHVSTMADLYQRANSQESEKADLNDEKDS